MSFMLASQRKAFAVISIPADATAQEKYAARELQYYMDLMTSAYFEIKEAPVDGAQIALGRAALAFMDEDKGLGEDGFAIAARGDVLAIQGGRRGVLYGVYELLEELGCRFFTANCEQVPCRVELPMPELNTRQVPTFEYRYHNDFEYSARPNFAVKSRINGQGANISEELGGNLTYTPGWFVHTFEQLVPTELYGESHPEYFAMRDGERKVLKHQSQLCLTNPDVLKIATESARAALRAHPGSRIISISQSDVPWGCQCEKCQAVDKEEGSAAGTLLRFVNAIAEELEKEFPDVVIDTLAYNHTRAIPKITHPRHNVCIRLCSIECCFAHPFESCDDERGILLPDGTRSSFQKDLHDWGSFHDRLYIWDYVTCFAHYPAPHPNWRVLQPNMQALKRNNVKGVFEQGNCSPRGGTDMNELRAYLLAKLMWDPDCDMERHLREFTDYYYGAAGKYIREYINALCDKADKDNIHVGFNDNPNTPLYSDEMLDLLDGIMVKAEQAVQGDPLRLWRVGKARLSVRYIRIKNDEMLKGKLSPEEVTKFFTDWREYGMGRIEEWVNIDTTHRALMNHMWRGVEFYSYWATEGRAEY